MKAVAYTDNLPISNPKSLVDITLERPHAEGHDLLVEIKAISVNPADAKRRMVAPPTALDKGILGWDAAGIVKEVGSDVTLFKPGDHVYYAGDVRRAGCNSQFQLVDERLVGTMPSNLDFAQAASLPLTSICAWEIIFDRLAITPTSKHAVLVVGASGGLGSMVVQLLKQLTKCTVIGTASREISIAWVKELGADFVINHNEPLKPQLDQLDIPAIENVISLNGTEKHFPFITELIAPQGSIALSDDPNNLDARLLKQKCLSLHWEWMFTRSYFQTTDMIEQHHILEQIGEIVEQNKIRSTANKNFGKITAENLRKAHELIESHQSVGKIVLEGF